MKLREVIPACIYLLAMIMATFFAADAYLTQRKSGCVPPERCEERLEPRSCPESIVCERDGMQMFEVGAYVENGQTQKRYGHDHFGGNGWEHHRVILVCK